MISYSSVESEVQLLSRLLEYNLQKKLFVLSKFFFSEVTIKSGQV